MFSWWPLALTSWRRPYFIHGKTSESPGHHVLSCLGPSEPRYMGPSLYYQPVYFVKFRLMCTESNRLLALLVSMKFELMWHVVLQGVVLGDHRSHYLGSISFGSTNSATLLFASARHTSTISLQLSDKAEGVTWRFPWGGSSVIILPDSTRRGARYCILTHIE